MRKKIFAVLLSFITVTVGFVPVKANETEVLLSKNKPIEWGIDGTGDVHSDTALHNDVDVMVDGIKGGDNNGSATNKQKMWYGRSKVNSDIIYINLDLEDAYLITKIGWRSRYTSANEISADYHTMIIYGANEADYSDKTVIYEVGTDSTVQNAEFVMSEENISAYRYIRFEKTRSMGGQELYVYGYANPDSNADLSELSVEGYSFDTEFSSETTEYTIISDGLPENNSVVVSAVPAVEAATVDGTGDITVDSYGTTVIPVTVTSANGKTKVYTINFVAIEAIDISSQVTATGSDTVYSGTNSNDLVLTDSYCTSLFTSAVTRFRVYIKYNDAGYIQADLKKAYRLTKFEYTKSNLEAGKELVITASNDPEFSDKVTIGNIGSLTKTETTASCLLDSENSYRYIRIHKTASAHDFLPLSMRIYATKEPLAFDSMNTGVNNNSDVELLFNDFLDKNMDTSAVEVTKNGKKVEADITVTDDKLVISPPDEWQEGGIYKVTIPENSITGADGRTLADELVKYFAVSTAELEVCKFDVCDNNIDLKVKNKKSESIDITLWNVAFDDVSCVCDSVSEIKTTVSSGATFEKVVDITDNCAVYLFEDAKNMKMFISPFVRNLYEPENVTYVESEDNVTAQYIDGKLLISGKSDADEVLFFVTDSEDISKDSVKVFTAAEVNDGAYAISISLPEEFKSDAYTVWVSDGRTDTPNKSADTVYVLSTEDKQDYADQLAGMSETQLKEFFENSDNSKVLSGIGVISDRPENTGSLYKAISDMDISGTYSETVAVINEQIVIAITKEKGVGYSLKNYSSILAVDETDENYKYASENNLFDSANTLMEKDYTDAKSFNEKLSKSLKLAIFKNSPSVEYAKTFASNNNEFFGFDFSGDYARLNGMHQQEAIKSAMNGTNAEEMKTLFDTAVKKYKYYGTNTGTGGGGGGAGGGGGGGAAATKPKVEIPMPEVTVAVENDLSFSDLSESHWAYNSVTQLAEAGIVNGTDGKFMPENDITREEFVKLLVLAAGIETDGEVSFEDVSKDAWHYKYIAAAKNSGIVNGVSEQLFGTGTKITRQDMTVMIYNACKTVGKTFENASQELGFADADIISDYAKEAVKQLCEAGIIKGRDNNMFAPVGNATRAEAAEIICRMLNLIS